MNEKQSFPSNVHLSFKKGDLIVKEGDYGISIYRILKGTVGIFIQSGEKEVQLTTLDRGEVIGEMSFLNRKTEPRSASARALENTHVEVWHPSRLAEEYKQMEPIIKYISDQVLRRLIRMNKFISKLGTAAGRTPLKPETATSQRHYYRKNLNITCEYRSLDVRKEAWLQGKIKNISLSGIGLDVSSRNGLNFPHEPGKMFRMRATLPNHKEVEVDARVITVRKTQIPGRLEVGLAMANITEEAKKILGFFLMP